MVFTGRKERIHLAITSANKAVSAPQIACGGSFRIMLSLTGTPDVAATPADVVLVLDRSGSMAGAGLTAMQQEADALIDALDLASDGAADGTIGSGTQAGVVKLRGHGCAGRGAGLDPGGAEGGGRGADGGRFFQPDGGHCARASAVPADTTNRKLMVIFTDGVPTMGGDPCALAAAAAAQNVTIYAVGICGRNGANDCVLSRLAGEESRLRGVRRSDGGALYGHWREISASSTTRCRDRRSGVALLPRDGGFHADGGLRVAAGQRGALVHPGAGRSGERNGDAGADRAAHRPLHRHCGRKRKPDLPGRSGACAELPLAGDPDRLLRNVKLRQDAVPGCAAAVQEETGELAGAAARTAKPCSRRAQRGRGRRLRRARRPRPGCAGRDRRTQTARTAKPCALFHACLKVYSAGSEGAGGVSFASGRTGASGLGAFLAAKARIMAATSTPVRSLRTEKPFMATSETTLATLDAPC